MASTNPPVIAVLGATGSQGQGVVAALLRCTKTNFSVLALTRDTGSEAARQLQARHQGDTRLKFGTANAFNFDSLLAAFKDAYGVFAVTNTRLSGKIIEKEEDMRHEVTAGNNIVQAAKVNFITCSCCSF
jgi:Predicted nucleoside-diphosphate-sugar epimerases